MKQTKDILRSDCLSMAARIMTHLDRDLTSISYGCFDRSYWHYKTQDYASLILQQGVHALSQLYSNNFLGNKYYRHPDVKKYVIAGVRFWQKSQHRNGSLAEYWPGESSIPATAFSLYAVCQAAGDIGYQDESLDKSIRRAVKFLSTHPEVSALNQEVASMCAIAAAEKFLPDSDFAPIHRAKLAVLQSQQSEEGWLSEYGGADISYLSVSLNYLMRYHRLTNNRTALHMAGRIVDFLPYFVHPDGSLGGEYGSRNTEYCLPGGLALAARHFPVASTMLTKIINSPVQPAYDDRYILHYIASSYVETLINFPQIKSPPGLPCDQSFAKFFPESEIYIFSNDKYYAIISGHKGGVIKAVGKNNHTQLVDAGYRIKSGRQHFTSESIRSVNRINFINENEIEIGSDFTKYNQLLPTTFRLLILRWLNYLIGPSIINWLRKLIIAPRSQTKGKLKRRIKYRSDQIEITDQIEFPGNNAELYSANGLSARHTASSKLFQTTNLDNLKKPATSRFSQKTNTSKTYHFNQ